MAFQGSRIEGSEISLASRVLRIAGRSKASTNASHLACGITNVRWSANISSAFSWALDLSDTLIFWEGRYFLASTGFDEDEKVGVEFRSRDNGIRLVFHHDDWQAIKSLFRRGWQAPQVVRLWNALAREYGEL